jgi:uncharacterized protein
LAFKVLRMPISLYGTSIPVFIRALTNLSAVLKKGEERCNEKGLDHSKLLDARLIDDMGALPFQIQRCSDTSKGVAARVGDIEPVAMQDNEKTFADLEKRIQATIELVKTVNPKDMEGKEDEVITFKAGGVDVKPTAKAYVLNYALPNFFFHVTTAYDILRHMGVQIGKRDFLGPFSS